MRLLLCISIVFCLISCETNKQPSQALPYYTSADFTPIWVEKEGVDTLHSIPSFSLLDQSGNNITEKSIDGHITVANFFFANCPGICKKLTNNLMLVQNAFPESEGIRILSHSVTPETDSVPRLKAYAAQYGINSRYWYLLTGNRKAIYQLARNAYFADEDLGMQQDENDFLHTENILLLDRNRHIRGVYKGTSVTEVNQLISDIRTLKAGE